MTQRVNTRQVTGCRDDARAAEEEIERYVSEIPDEDHAQVWDAGDWLQGIGKATAQAEHLGITATSTDEDLDRIGQKILADADSDGVDGLTGLEYYLNHLREQAREAAETAAD